MIPSVKINLIIDITHIAVIIEDVTFADQEKKAFTGRFSSMKTNNKSYVLTFYFCPKHMHDVKFSTNPRPGDRLSFPR